MKTAVLISGQIRSAKDSFDSISKHIIEPYSADVFINTWHPSSNILNHGYAHREVEENDSNIDEITSLYNPKLLISEDFNNSNFVQKIKEIYEGNLNKKLKMASDGSFADETRLENVLFMYYKLYQSYKSMEMYEQMTETNYQYIFKIRFDVKYFEKISIDTNQNTINIPSGMNHRGGINDLFAAGPRNLMEIYLNLFTKINNYIEMGFGLHPESLLRTHLTQNNVPVNRFQTFYQLKNRFV
jgi:hypothetical protein